MGIFDSFLARGTPAGGKPASDRTMARAPARGSGPPERSLDELRQLVRRSPANARLLIGLAFALDDAARTATEREDLSAALALRNEALEARRQLAKVAPNDPNSVRFQWSGLSELAQLHRTIGNEAEAAALFDEGLTLMKRLVESYPDDPRLRQDYLAALVAMADTNVRAGDRDAARAKFDQAVAEGRQALAHDPESDAARRMLAVALEKSGADHAHLGKFDAAIAEVRDAMKVREARAASDPGKPILSFEYANTIVVLVWALTLAGKPEAALEESQEALVRLCAVAAAEPNRHVTEQLVTLLSRRAELWEQLGKQEEAEASHDEALRWARAGVRAEDDWDGLRLLRERLDAKEFFLYRMGRHQDGLAPRLESLALLQRAFRVDPSFETLQDVLRRAMAQLSGHEAFLGDVPAALQAAEARLFLASLAATRQPNDARVVAELAESYGSVARWRGPGAKRLAQRECHRLLTRLHEAGVATPEQQQQLKEVGAALAQASDAPEIDPIAYCAPWDTPSKFKDDVKAECFVCARPVRQRPHLLPVRKLCLPCLEEQNRLHAREPAQDGQPVNDDDGRATNN